MPPSPRSRSRETRVADADASLDLGVTADDGAMRAVRPLSTRDRTSWTTVAVSFANFASFHAVREGYMACKSTLHERAKYPTTLLGAIDFGFCASYACGLLAAGHLGRRYGARKTIAVSFLLTGLLSIAFGAVIGHALAPKSEDEARTAAWTAHVPLWTASAFVQAWTYPNFIALLSDSIEPYFRATVLTMWATASPVGDIVGLQIAQAVLRQGEEHWPNVMFVAGAFVLLNLVLFLVCIGANKVRIVRDEEDEDEEASSLLDAPPASETVEDESPQAGFWQVMSDVWKIPGVLDYAFSVMALKVVVTSLLFWIPYYVDERFDSHSSSIVSTQFFDLSVILGIGFAALLNRLVGRWVLLFLVSLVLGLVPLLAVPYAKTLGGTVSCIFLAGFLIGPAAALFAGVMSAEVGKKAKVHSDHGGIIGVISGLIDSAGAVGSGTGQILVGALASTYGWHTVFKVLAGFVAIGAVSLVRVRRMEKEEVSTRK